MHRGSVISQLDYLEAINSRGGTKTRGLLPFARALSRVYEISFRALFSQERNSRAHVRLPVRENNGFKGRSKFTWRDLHEIATSRGASRVEKISK